MFEKVLQFSGAGLILLCAILGYSFGFTEVPSTPTSTDLELGLNSAGTDQVFIWSVALNWWLNGFFWGMTLIGLSYILEKLHEKEKAKENTPQ